MKISYNSQPQRNLIGNQIFKLRKSRKLSQKEMAAQLQVQGYYFSELTILRIEKGKRLVTDIELKILCDYFRITPICWDMVMAAVWYSNALYVYLCII